MNADSHPRYPNCFRPVRVGGLELENRIFVPAHTTNYGEDNMPSERHLAYHRARAAGGVSMIMFEGIRVHRTCLGRPQGVAGYDPSAIPRYAKIADVVHAEGARLFGQILPLGRQVDGNYTRTPAWGPSPIPWAATAPVPHPMTADEIAEIVEAHALSARNLVEAGLDGLEVHFGHGHLLEQFLSPVSNLRDDDYGGSEEHRMRFPIETFRAVRAAVGSDVPLGIRISADEYEPGGLSLDDMCRIVPKLAAALDLDFINVSHAAYIGSYSLASQMADMNFAANTFRHLPGRIRAALAGVKPDLPLFAACRYRSLAEAEEVLAKGDAEMIGMARAHIAEPRLVNLSREGREDEITPCIGCNQGCAAYLQMNLPITCLVNQIAGMEGAWPEADRAAERKRVLVIGGGPGGMEAAGIAALRGHEVTLWEASKRLGGRLNWLRPMPLRQDFLKLLDHQEARLRRAGVAVELNRRATPRTIIAFGAQDVVLATGARASRGLSRRRAGPHPRGGAWRSGRAGRAGGHRRCAG